MMQSGSIAWLQIFRGLVASRFITLLVLGSQFLINLADVQTHRLAATINESTQATFQQKLLQASKHQVCMIEKQAR